MQRFIFSKLFLNANKLFSRHRYEVTVFLYFKIFVFSFHQKNFFFLVGNPFKFRIHKSSFMVTTNQFKQNFLMWSLRRLLDLSERNESLKETKFYLSSTISSLWGKQNCQKKGSHIASQIRARFFFKLSEQKCTFMFLSVLFANTKLLLNLVN